MVVKIKFRIYTRLRELRMVEAYWLRFELKMKLPATLIEFSLGDPMILIMFTIESSLCIVCNTWYSDKIWQFLFYKSEIEGMLGTVGDALIRHFLFRLMGQCANSQTID